jgi:hypothetical protein
MPRYFFTLQDGQAHPDGEGVILSGPDEACAQAAATAGEILRDLAGRFWDHPEWRMQVTDEHGTLLCTLQVRGRTGPDHDQDAGPEQVGDG